jgi:Family of unknown function (DUF6256)/Family of unknown function (DUF6186)
MALVRARLIGSTGWVVILTAFVAWEALGLLVGHGWPTLSHITREVTRWRVGRWLLLGAWLWLGWHLFIRGWRFFLRGPQTKVVEPSALGSGFRELLAEVLVLGTALVLVFVGLLRRGAEHAEPERRRRPVGFAGLLLRVLAVAASCYAVLVGFIVLYILVAGNDPSHLLRGAVGGGALLAFGVVVPGFLILSVLDAGIARLRRARREPSG